MQRNWQPIEITRKEYDNIHRWMKYHYGKASKCTATDCPKKSSCFSWALKKGCKYEKNRDNFIELCRSCHSKYDTSEETKRKMSKSKTTKKTMKLRLVWNLPDFGSIAILVRDGFRCAIWRYREEGKWCEKTLGKCTSGGFPV